MSDTCRSDRLINENQSEPSLSATEEIHSFSQLTSLLRQLDETPEGSEAPASDEAHLIYARLGMASSLFNALRWRHAATASHSVRVALSCSSLLASLQLPESERDDIEVAALLHDIGKIGIPDSILLKADALSEDEIQLIQQHNLIAIDILQSCCSSESVLEIILHSSTWFDGSQFVKNGRSGTALPLGSRIIALLDAFDSMTSDQVYRPAISHDRAIAELYRKAGTQFDPDLVQKFAEIYQNEHQKLHVTTVRRWLQHLDSKSSSSRWNLAVPSLLSSTEENPLIPEWLFQQKLLDNMNDAVIFLNRNLQVIRWNRSAEKITGLTAASVHQCHFSPSMIKMRYEDGNPVQDGDCLIVQALQTGTQIHRRMFIEGRGRKKNDVAIDLHIVPVVASDGITIGATVVMHDASPEASLEERCQNLLEKAMKDPLTQLANRAEFDRVHALFVEEHLQRGLPCSLIICDIDRFKQINDSYGHQAGDEIIRSFALQLKANCRSGDLVARYGGEEFVMLCADCSNAIALARAEKIRENFSLISQPVVDGKNVSASFGVTEIQAGDTAATMLRRADRALLMAKDSGRNMVIQLGAGLTDEIKPVRKPWWQIWSAAPGDILLEKNIVSDIPLSIAIEKLKGFIADHHAEVMSIDSERIEFCLPVDSSAMLRRHSDRPTTFIMNLQFHEHRDEANSSAFQTRIQVAIRPRKGRDRRQHDATLRAQDVLASLKSYLIATEDPRAYPSVKAPSENQ